MMDSMITNGLGDLDLFDYHGQPWASWIDKLDDKQLSSSNQKKNKDCRVIKLPRKDMSLYGVCPETERFCAVVCTSCGAVVKAQGLQRHLELKHSSDTESPRLPPPLTPAKKTKVASVKVKISKEAIITPPIHSNDSVFPHVIQSSSVNPIETSSSSNPVTKSHSSKVTTSSSSYGSDSSIHSSSHIRRKSPNSHDRKSTKVREKSSSHDTDKNGSTDDGKRHDKHKSKSSSSSSRKDSVGRTKDFNKLVADHRATKDKESSLSSITSASSSSKSVFRPILPTKKEDKEPATTSSLMSSLLKVVEIPPPPPLPLVIQAAPIALDMPLLIMDDSPIPPAPPEGEDGIVVPDILTASKTPPRSVDFLLKSTVGTNSGEKSKIFKCSAPVVESENAVPEFMSTSTSATSQVRNLVTYIQQGEQLTYVQPPQISYVQQTVPIPMDTSIFNSNSNSSTSSRSTTSSLESCGSQVVHMIPVTTHVPLYTVNPLIIINSNNALQNVPPVPMPSVNLNVNTESMCITPRLPIINIQSPQPLTETLNVPVLMQIPTLPNTVTNIKVYTTYPKPLLIAPQPDKNVGHTIISSKRVNELRDQFKTVLKNKKVPARRPNNVRTNPYGVRTLNSNICRVIKTSGTNIQSPSMHRPNILRAPSTTKHQHILPKIMQGGKRSDCKHVILKPAGNNINVVNGIIGKMIVHQHEMTESTDGSNHLVLDKVVPVNIK